MTMRGVHFAIDDSQLEALRERSGNDDMFDYVGDVLEEQLFDSGFDAETDKAWGLIHQTLIAENPCADGLERRDTPLSWVIMGEKTLSDSDWFMVNVTTSAAVLAVQNLLEPISREDFEARLRFLLKAHDCPDIGEEDVGYAGHWFENMKKVFKAAQEHGRHVIFTVDY